MKEDDRRVRAVGFEKEIDAVDGGEGRGGKGLLDWERGAGWMGELLCGDCKRNVLMDWEEGAACYRLVAREAPGLSTILSTASG